MGQKESLEFAQTGFLTTDAEYLEKSAVWTPDVEMPQPFAPHHLLMASLFARGKSVKYIADVIGRSHLYTVKLFNDVYCPQSLPNRIREATGYTPKSTVHSILWMSKHHFLEPHPSLPMPMINVTKPFNISQLKIMNEYMSGNTTHRGISKKLFLSEGVIRNYLSTLSYSIRAVISKISPDRWKAPNAISAGFWMVEHGYLPEDIIGEQLP